MDCNPPQGEETDILDEIDDIKWKLLEISVLLQRGKNKKLEEENEKLEGQLDEKMILVEKLLKEGQIDLETLESRGIDRRR